MTTTTDQTVAQAQQGAREILDAFNAKARQVATANGWTVEKAQEVMLGYLRNTSPETAAIVAASVLVTA